MVNYDRIFIARTTLMAAITLGVQWFIPHPGVMLVVNVMLYLAVILMGPVSAAVIALLSPWLCYHRSFIVPALSSMIPYITVGSLVMILVFYALHSSKLSIWLRGPLAIVLSALARFIIVHVPSVTYVRVPSSVKTQLLQLLFTLVGGVAAILLAQLLRHWGIQDFHTLKTKGTVSA